MTYSILFISLDYPPKGGPGAKRNYYLKKHFSQLGWQTKVLTITTSAFKASSKEKADDIDVIRAYGKDATQVFSIAGKYPKIVEIPDRWYLWIIPALIKGLKLHRSTPLDYIYAGFPTYSSVIVGVLLSKLLRKPLVVDLRDPFRFRYDSQNMPTHWLFRYIERKMVSQAAKILTTTQECARYYQKLYPNFPAENFHVVPNGFAHEFHQTLGKVEKTTKDFILLHSGVLYKIGRNPKVLLAAIQRLVRQGTIKKGQFILRFRGANIWPELHETIKQLDLSEYVEFKKSIPYHDAIKEMQAVSANVLIQNSLFNMQIPSKLYDILALKKPLLAITDEQGALAKEMDNLNVPYYCSSVDKTVTLLTNLMNNTQQPLSDQSLQVRSRLNINLRLSKILISYLQK